MNTPSTPRGAQLLTKVGVAGLCAALLLGPLSVVAGATASHQVKRITIGEFAHGKTALTAALARQVNQLAATIVRDGVTHVLLEGYTPWHLDNPVMAGRASARAHHVLAYLGRRLQALGDAKVHLTDGGAVSGLFTNHSNDRVVVASFAVPGVNYRVTFDANGGTGTMPAESSNGAAVRSTDTFLCTGYTFAGWNTAAKGSGMSYADAATYPFSADRDPLRAVDGARGTDPGADRHDDDLRQHHVQRHVGQERLRERSHLRNDRIQRRPARVVERGRHHGQRATRRRHLRGQRHGARHAGGHRDLELHVGRGHERAADTDRRSHHPDRRRQRGHHRRGLLLVHRPAFGERGGRGFV